MVDIRYWKEDDIMTIDWRKSPDNYDSSLELVNVNVLIDIDKEGELLGLEIYDFKDAVKRGQEKINKIFKNAKKSNHALSNSGRTNINGLDTSHKPTDDKRNVSAESSDSLESVKNSSKSQTEQLHDAIGEELNKDYDAFQSGGDKDE